MYDETLDKKLQFADSYTRMGVLIDHFEVFDTDWFQQLGEWWCNCDNIAAYRDDLVKIFSLTRKCTKTSKIDPMMTSEELAAFDALPDEIEIYRGCYANNKNGLSWSLDAEVARTFPFLNRYRQRDAEALLLKATVKKKDVVAIKLEREEAEIITAKAKVFDTTAIYPAG